MLFRKEPAQSALRPNDCLATLKFSKLPKTLRHRENPSKTYKKHIIPRKKPTKGNAETNPMTHPRTPNPFWSRARIQLHPQEVDWEVGTGQKPHQ